MRRIIVNGGAPLSGKVSASGSKNAALPILFATLMTDGVSRIENLPDIGDVRAALGILRGFGAKISRSGSVTLIDTSSLTYSPPRQEEVRRIRASTYLIGACLSRFGICELSDFGGCNFSARPIDLHIAAAEAMGAVSDGKRLVAKTLFGSEISFPKPSVGATVNAILLASSAVGETVIRGFACEVHVDALIKFLISSGADIERGADVIKIKGRCLHGGSVRIPPDMIEAGTFLALGAHSEKGITVTNCEIAELSSAFEVLSSLGAELGFGKDGITARRGEKNNFTELTATPYPGFPTDLQPIFAVPMHISGGKITDTVWPSRFGYLSELARFGLVYRTVGNTAYIEPSRLDSAVARAPDLRGGMACIMAAILAKGKSVVDSVEIVERGYENLEAKLRSLGADVKIFEE